MACLVVTAGTQQGTYFQLAKRTITVGREPARDIQLTDAKVSRKDFQIRFENEKYLLLMLKSKNGVLINGVKVETERVLNDGDEIQAGDTVLVFQESDDPERTNAIFQRKDAARTNREDRTIS